MPRETYQQAIRNNDGRPSCLLCHTPMRWQRVQICECCLQEVLDAHLWAAIVDHYYPLTLVKKETPCPPK